VRGLCRVVNVYRTVADATCRAGVRCQSGAV
jgi:hypothetical protein